MGKKSFSNENDALNSIMICKETALTVFAHFEMLKKLFRRHSSENIGTFDGRVTQPFHTTRANRDRVNIAL
jgi:hypothetical protein